ncbi:transcriptional regulator [Nostoc calcicola FACHB-389]|nr:Uma2 family endonuclease [Nostoc calcicola FACHB-3891]OKH39936.1 transcriptional regulator [Nostoc calcicola FACHB-389]
MTSATNLDTDLTPFPDHTQLPDSDGTFVKNWQEHPQSILLTDSITPILQQLHPEGQYCIGQDLGIYWRLTDPPEKGAAAPDWFYVGNVPPLLDGLTRRSYVFWREHIAPLIVLEFVSGDGSEERDTTPWKGKFWIYEQVIRPPFYGIYEVNKASIEVYEFVGGQYQLLPANERGHYRIPPLGVELGIWLGIYQNVELPWLRWWDLQGNLLLTGDERAELERQRAEQERQRAEQESQRAELERQRAEQERQRNEILIAQLRSLGVEPEA